MTKEQVIDNTISSMKDIMPFSLSDEIEPYVKESIGIGYDKGYESAELKWIPFNRETSKQFEQCQDRLLLFDNGQTCRYDEEHPFAIMTHFLPIPKLPKNE